MSVNVGHGFIRADSGIIIAADYLCYAYPSDGRLIIAPTVLTDIPVAASMNACPTLRYPAGRLVNAVTVLADILVLINVGRGFIRAVSGIVIVVDYLCSAYPCDGRLIIAPTVLTDIPVAASMNACPTVLADILVLINAGRGFIRADSGFLKIPNKKSAEMRQIRCENVNFLLNYY